MRTLSAVLIVVAGFSQLGCGDDGGGPGVGPLTSWQLGCIQGKSCGSSQDAHGPVGGTDEELDDDDQKLKVTCKSTGAGLNITIEDPGRKLADPVIKTIRARARSVLEITNINAENNKCFVTLTEYPRSGVPQQLKVIETCSGTKAAQEGNCEITGKKANGYDFDGTLRCPGMRDKGTGPANYELGAARAIDDPIELQIISCS